MLGNKQIDAEGLYISQQFEKGQRIEQVILILDVDGVVRDSVEESADPRVVSAIKSLIDQGCVDVTFISGTPVDNDPNLEFWRKGNVPLNKVFGSLFKKELAEDHVTVYGALGGHKMRQDGSLEVIDEYALEISFEIGRFLVAAFLQEVLYYGSFEQKKLGKHLEIELDSLKLEDFTQTTNATAGEFYQIISKIHEYFDPNFRLIYNCALIETQTSYPLWNTALSSQWLRKKIENFLPASDRQLATGVAKRGGKAFSYFLVSKTNKGVAIKRHIEEKIKKFPQALIVTIGDTQVDFPMHENAHIAFHVGLESVWRNNPLAQCRMVRSSSGEDSQHIEGTLKVLKLLEEAIRKHF